MTRILTFYLLVLMNTSFAQNSKGVAVPGSKEPKGRTFALIIGIADYQQLPKLNFAPADAVALKEYLVDEQKLPKENVFCFINDEATSVNIFDKLYLINDSLKANDRFLFYFSGHGDWESKISDNALLLLSKAPRQNYLRYPDQFINSQTLNEFLKRLSERNIKTVMIADACHSGNLSGGTEGAKTTNLQLKQAWNNDIRILSCMPDEVSFEDKRWGGGRGVFSYYLTLGLNGMTRKGNPLDFDLTLGELRNFLEENISRETGGRQNPLFEGDSRVIVARVKKQNTIQNAIALVSADSKGIARAKGSLDTANTDYRNLIILFNQAVGRGNLIEPLEASAFYYYKQLMKYVPEYFLDKERNSLLKSVQDHYRSYSEQFYEQVGFPEDELNILKKELEAAMKLTLRKEVLFNSFYSKKLFIEASIITYPVQHTVNKQLDRIALQSAIDSLGKAIKLTPYEPSLYRKLGDCTISVDPPKAIQSFIRYTELLPNDDVSYNSLGVAYFNSKDFMNAITAFQKAIRIAPKKAKYYYNAGLCFQKLGRNDEAVYYFQKSQRLNQVEDFSEN